MIDKETKGWANSILASSCDYYCEITGRILAEKEKLNWQEVELLQEITKLMLSLDKISYLLGEGKYAPSHHCVCMSNSECDNE